MCARYTSFLPPEAIARLFHTTGALPNVAPSWNVAPSQQGMVVRRHPENGARHLDLLTWGLVPHWTNDLQAARRPICTTRSTSNAGTRRGARPVQQLRSSIARASRARKKGLSDRRGFDARKKIKGEKRHALVDTQGLLMLAVVHAADI